jgi:hypothetical protein
LLGGLGTLLPFFFSDENLKEDVVDANKGVEELMDALNAVEYRYKDPEAHGEGKRLGILAQDVAKSRLGREIVIDRPEGMAIDTNKAVSALMAAVANTHDRLKQIEAG